MSDVERYDDRDDIEHPMVFIRRHFNKPPIAFASGFLSCALLALVLYLRLREGSYELIPDWVGADMPVEIFHFTTHPLDSDIMLLAIENKGNNEPENIKYYALPIRVRITSTGMRARQIYVGELPDFVVKKIDSIMANEINLLNQTTGGKGDEP